MIDPPGRVRWNRWAVGFSVALNLFLVTFLGAQVWRHRHPDNFIALSTTRTVVSGEVAQTFAQQLAAALPPADGRLLRESFAARLPELVRLQRRSLAAAEQVRRDVGQRPYDSDKVRADMLAAREARQAIRPVIEQILLETLPRMSDQGRQAFSEYRILPDR